MARERFYAPGRRGFERDLRERLLSFAAQRARKERSSPTESASREPTYVPKNAHGTKQPPDLVQLVYVSCAAPTLTAADLDAIADCSRAATQPPG